MRTLTLIAIAVVAAGAYHFSTGRRRQARARLDPVARRLRAAIESSVSNPGEIDVRVHRGTVTLRGRVRREERDFVLAAALGAPGITRVNNLLEVQDQPGELGTLQSGMATGA